MRPHRDIVHDVTGWCLARLPALLQLDGVLFLARQQPVRQIDDAECHSPLSEYSRVIETPDTPTDGMSASPPAASIASATACCASAGTSAIMMPPPPEPDSLAPQAPASSA